MSQKVTILGCGRWASFHAWYQATVLGADVLMWGRRGDPMFESLRETRKNDFLTLPQNITLSNDLEKAISFSEVIMIIISAQGMRDLSKRIAKILAEGTGGGRKIFVLCMKGIDEETHETLSQLMRRELDAVLKPMTSKTETSIVVWVGPGHAQEFLSGQPGVMIIDGEDRDVALEIVERFKSDSMKLYLGDDLIGAEIGAAAKNVFGIAAGILDGAGLQSLKGALMSRGLHEVSRLIVAMGGKKLTPYGLSHLGDFEATLFSRNSNNRRFGEAIIKFIKDGNCNNLRSDCFRSGQIINRCQEKDCRLRELALAEGVATSLAIYNLGKKYNVDLPISNLIYRVLHEGADPFTGFKELFFRSNNKEFS